MITSSSGLADALITTLQTQSASVFNTSNVTKNDFGLLDTTNSGCVFMVLPGGFEREPLGFGTPSLQRVQQLSITAYVRDTGNSTTTLNKIWQLEKDLGNALDANCTLSGSATFAYLKHGDPWTEDNFLETGGQIWAVQRFTVEVLNDT